MQILLRRANEVPNHQAHSTAQQQRQRIACPYALKEDKAPQSHNEKRQNTGQKIQKRFQAQNKRIFIHKEVKTRSKQAKRRFQTKTLQLAAGADSEYLTSDG